MLQSINFKFKRNIVNKAATALISMLLALIRTVGMESINDDIKMILHTGQ
jgi:hypothetical protein